MFLTKIQIVLFSCKTLIRLLCIKAISFRPKEQSSMYSPKGWSLFLPNNYEHMAIDSIVWEMVNSLNTFIGMWVPFKPVKLKSRAYVSG